MQGLGAVFFAVFIFFVLLTGSWVWILWGLIAFAVLGTIVSNNNTQIESAQSKRASEVPYASRAQGPPGASDESKVADTSANKIPPANRKKRWSRARKRRKMMQTVKRRYERKHAHHIVPKLIAKHGNNTNAPSNS